MRRAGCSRIKGWHQPQTTREEVFWGDDWLVKHQLHLHREISKPLEYCLCLCLFPRLSYQQHQLGYPEKTWRGWCLSTAKGHLTFILLVVSCCIFSCRSESS